MSDVWVLTENEGTGDETVVRGVYGSLELAKAAGEVLIVANRKYWDELAKRQHPEETLERSEDEPVAWEWDKIENDFHGGWKSFCTCQVVITSWPLQTVAP